MTDSLERFTGFRCHHQKMIKMEINHMKKTLVSFMVLVAFAFFATIGSADDTAAVATPADKAVTADKASPDAAKAAPVEKAKVAKKAKTIKKHKKVRKSAKKAAVKKAETAPADNAAPKTDTPN